MVSCLSRVYTTQPLNINLSKSILAIEQFTDSFISIVSMQILEK